MDETSEVFGCTRGIVPVTGIKRVVSVVTDHKVISFGNNPFFTRLYIADTVIGLEDITLTGSVGLCLVLSCKTIFFNQATVLFTVYREDFIFVVCDGIARNTQYAFDVVNPRNGWSVKNEYVPTLNSAMIE
ncbi:hypothetical protein HMPREF9688_05362 [Klebsiella oxytoca 10-5244]|uniref:Uncharacterized protein n=1 Tax=Enterobacter roggenkampii TaxID=1812935 RepID=A0A837LKV3_9ENTR|nr:hypothetical protein ABF77_00025 [Enterobacter roggenkampii]KMV84880.1 hypothetical protein HMPREF9688_05362 [Klebsiella oxytoca 10-5244]OHY62046.1 hypothetical protein BB778_24925 [Pluralibacter gergoviae]